MTLTSSLSETEKSFLLSHLESVFHAIGYAKAQYFSNFYLIYEFWQIKLEEECPKKAAFIQQYVVYKWKGLPFGSFANLFSNAYIQCV